ncbi:MAG: hypothetical protein AB7P18_20035 [Candidatus Binatia bacterium]
MALGVAGALIVAHRLVPTILRSEQHALLSGRIMLITMKTRETSQSLTFPVDYLREGNTVYVGSDSGWWKHLEGGAEVHLLIAGSEVMGWATPILDDPERSKAGFKQLRPWTYKRALWSGAVFAKSRSSPRPRRTSYRIPEHAPDATPGYYVPHRRKKSEYGTR